MKRTAAQEAKEARLVGLELLDTSDMSYIALTTREYGVACSMLLRDAKAVVRQDKTRKLETMVLRIFGEKHAINLVTGMPHVGDIPNHMPHWTHRRKS